MRELHPQRAKSLNFSPSSRLEEDLGIDSLARTELILRIERAFHARLPADMLGEAETILDLVRGLAQSERKQLIRPEAPPPLNMPFVQAATEARTLMDVLQWHVANHPDRLHLSLLQEDLTVLGAMTYRELAGLARRVASGLIQRDVEPGDRVAIMLPTSIDFFTVFFGVLYAGAIPVPIYPPMRVSQIEDHLRRQANILNDAGARILVTMPEGRKSAALLRPLVESLVSIESAASLSSGMAEVSARRAGDEKSIALIQYTSGSTGDPKGVTLTHANLLANIRAIGRAMDASSSDIFVSWLPVYHDMGLIGAWLGCLYFGAPLYVLSPLSFLVRPECWLWAMHRYRATLSGSPNFGFELCLDKVDEANLQGLDLRRLRMVVNGAEPVSVQTLRRFMRRFARYGFQPSAMAPVYGLAENSVGLAFPPLGRAPVIDRVDRDSLSRRGVAEPSKAGDPHPLEIVGCGRPLADHEIRVVDDLARELGERHEGRIEFRGPSATSGYFRNDAKTRKLIRGGWLDTGDRGYMAGGDIYVTGRIKDIIIRAGRHIYPQEIEEAVGEIPGVRKGCVAVFGAPDPRSETEKVVVLAETRETDVKARAALAVPALVRSLALSPARPLTRLFSSLHTQFQRHRAARSAAARQRNSMQAAALGFHLALCGFKSCVYI